MNKQIVPDAAMEHPDGTTRHAGSAKTGQK
jgi:hypothetical protein